jgi:hypothetical protein
MAPETPLTSPWNNAVRGSSDGVMENQMKSKPTAVPVNV